MSELVWSVPCMSFHDCLTLSDTLHSDVYFLLPCSIYYPFRIVLNLVPFNFIRILDTE